MTPRFVKTQREMEGRFEDVWVLVDEDDDVETGRRRRRAARSSAARRRARTAPCARAARPRYTVDVQLAGDAPRARPALAASRTAACASLDLDAARATPGVRAVIGPDSGRRLTSGDRSLAAEPAYAGAADRRRRGGHARGGARRALARARARPRAARARRRPATRPSTSSASPSEPARDASAATPRRRSPRPTCAVEVALRDARRTCRRRSSRTPPSPAGTATSSPRGSRRRGCSTPATSSRGASGSRQEQVRVLTEYVGGGFGGKQGAGFEALARGRARPRHRPAGAARHDRHDEQLDGGRRSCDPADRDARRDARRHARRDRARGRSSTWAQGGWIFPVAEPALSLYALRRTSARWSSPCRRTCARRTPSARPGVIEGTTVFEQAIDELAAALGLDPLELRRRNHVDLDQVSGAALLEQAAARLLRPRRRARRLGRARRAPRAAAPTGSCAGWAARRRSGGAAAGRRRTRPCGSTPTAHALASRRASRTSARAR